MEESLSGTDNAGGAQVWQYDGIAWTNVSPAWAAANRMAFSMAVYGANFYVGTNNAGGAQVWQYNGTTWTNVTPGWTAANITAAGVAVYGANFYVGTDNSPGGPAQVWQLELPVFPEQGTIGTVMTMKGSGFGAAKGKVLVGKAGLTILEWKDSLINCQLTRPMTAGTYNVTIQPKARGASPIILENGFTVVAPEIDFTEPASGSIGEEITVNGFLFGTTKGKVTLGGKNCKILSWKMDPTTGESEIHFVAPKGLSLGAHELKVTNGAGVDTMVFAIK